MIEIKLSSTRLFNESFIYECQHLMLNKIKYHSASEDHELFITSFLWNSMVRNLRKHFMKNEKCQTTKFMFI